MNRTARHTIVSFLTALLLVPLAATTQAADVPVPPTSPTAVFSQWAQTPPMGWNSYRVLLFTGPTQDLKPVATFLSAEFSVQVNRKGIAVYGVPNKHTGPYSFAGFDLRKPVEVRIQTRQSLDHVVIRPAGIPFTVNGRELALKLDRPQKLSIEPAGRRGALLLFANPVERQPPCAESGSVIHFGPGIHRPAGGRVVLTDNQTLYLEDGAIVLGTVEARNATNVHIAGRGILDGSSWPWQKGPSRFLVQFHNCTNASIEGITFRSSFFWTAAIISCDRVSITNLKILGGLNMNDDGLDICNSRRVTVRDCFIRTDDDCISIKGVPTGNIVRFGYVYDWPPAREREPVENIDIADCLFWGDRARIIEIGPECQATHMRNIRIRDSEALHCGQCPPLMFEAGEECRLEDITFSNLRINAEDSPLLIELQSAGNNWQKQPSPAYVNRVRFANLRFEGAKTPRIHIFGTDKAHAIRDIVFNNLVVNGTAQKAGASLFQIGEHVEAVSVQSSEPARRELPE